MAISNAVNGPEAAPYLAKAGGTMTGGINMNSQTLTNVPSPSAGGDAANKTYVDTVASGLTTLEQARVATIGNLNATYANGASGVGATLTNAGAMAAISIDGISLSANDRVLVKDQTTTFQNGIYTVTTVGSGAANWVLTRATDFDTPSEIDPGDFVIISAGDANTGTGWIQTATVTTIGTDAILWSLFSSIASADQQNFIIGGNFDTNPWQRGTTFTGATGNYNADMFVYSSTGAGVADILKTADAPTVAQAGIFTQNCFHHDVTTADGAIAAGDLYYIRYAMEGYDWAQLAQRAFTVSFWVKSTKTGIFTFSVGNDVDRTYATEYTINTTNTWEKKVITVTASPSAGTWNYTNGLGLRINWIIAGGTNFQTSTLNTWNSDTLRVSSNQVNGMDSTSNNFKLQLIKVEIGTGATPWDNRSAGVELELCQRYFTKTFPQGIAPVENVGNFAGAITYHAAVAGATANGAYWSYPVTMRTAPTLTFYNPKAAGTAWYNNNDGGNSGASAAVDIGGLGDRGVLVQNAQVATDAAGEVLGIHAVADASI